MTNEQMADYILTIKADSGYESATEGRCSAEQYGQAIAALHDEAPQRKPLTDEEIDAMLLPEHAGDSEMHDFARAIEAAHGIKGEA